MGIFLLIFLNQNSWGNITLHDIIIQYAQAYGPKALFINVNCSTGLPLYHAIKNSIAYAYPTMEPVARSILFIFSRVLTVIICSMLNTLRTIMSTVETMPNPEKIAPATKYGGKI